MISYWEQQSFTRYDFVVVGAGIVGLSTALELRALAPSARILVAERGILPTGASTRNAGFAATGSLTELLDDLRTSPSEAVTDLFAYRLNGLRRLRERCGDANIAYHEPGSYELLRTRELDALGDLERINELLQPLIGRRAFDEAYGELGRFPFDQKQVLGLVRNNTEGALDSGRMMRVLLQKARQADIELMTGADVESIGEEAAFAVLSVRDALRGDTFRLQAGRCILCTNAFTGRFLPEADVVPGRGQVLVTDPVPGLDWEGIFHFDAGYYYFRTIDGRILLGGGRNLDFEGETSTKLSLSPHIQDDLLRQLRTLILPGRDIGVSFRWSGIMAFGKTKRPIVTQLSPHLFGAFRMGGMGVAIGSAVGYEVARLAAT